VTGVAVGLAVLAGLAGSVQVAVMGRFGSRIGVAEALVVALIAGQLVMAALIDRFGLFGVDQITVSWPRLAGILLLGAGAALSLAR
jgi:transporter family-2 protein